MYSQDTSKVNLFSNSDTQSGNSYKSLLTSTSPTIHLKHSYDPLLTRQLPWGLGYRYSFICVVVRKLAWLLTLTTESLMKWTVSSYRNEVFPHMLWISSNTWVRNTNEATWLVWSVFESSFDLWMKPLIDVRCNGRYDLCGALSCGVQQPALMFEHLMALSCFSFLKSYCVTWVLLNWQVCCVGVCGGDRFAQYGSLLRVRFFHVRNK